MNHHFVFGLVTILVIQGCVTQQVPEERTSLDFAVLSSGHIGCEPKDIKITMLSSQPSVVGFYLGVKAWTARCDKKDFVCSMVYGTTGGPAFQLSCMPR